MRKTDGLNYMAYAMGRMPYIWGEDAEDFRPERWLNNGIFQPESPFKFTAFHVISLSLFISFSCCKHSSSNISVIFGTSLCINLQAGPRICLGKDFAYRQMKIVSMALLRFFRFKLADDTRKVTYKTMFTLHIDGGLHLRAIPMTCS